MEYVDVDGLRVAFKREGAGPAVVLLHGILQDNRAWWRQVPGLSSDFTVFRVDLPGCGESSDPPETFRLPDIADCLAAALDESGIEQAHLVGLSWGGGLALQFAALHPERVISLVLTGAYAGWAGSLPAVVVEQRLQQALRESELPAGEFVSGWIPGLLTDAAPHALRDEVLAMMSAFHPAGYRTMALAFAEADLRDTLPAITAPALLLWGAEDRRAPLSVAEELHSAIPNSKLVLLPGAGHLSNIEAPDAFNREIRAFLEKVKG